MRVRALWLFLFLLLVPPSARAEDTLQSDVAKELASTERKQFLTFNVENDLFGGGTDRNYTSGVRVTWFDAGAKPPSVFNNVSKVFPAFTINKTTSIYYTLGQNLYT